MMNDRVNKICAKNRNIQGVGGRVSRGVTGAASETPLEGVAKDARRWRLVGRHDEAAEARGRLPPPSKQASRGCRSLSPCPRNPCPPT